MQNIRSQHIRDNHKRTENKIDIDNKNKDKINSNVHGKTGKRCYYKKNQFKIVPDWDQGLRKNSLNPDNLNGIHIFLKSKDVAKRYRAKRREIVQV